MPDVEPTPDRTGRRAVPWALVVGAAVLGVAAALVIIGQGDRAEAPTTAESSIGPTAVQEPDGQLDSVPSRAPDDPLAIGSPAAAVTLVVLSDYQCPYCAQWHEQTLPHLQDYVDSGDLRIEWRDTVVYGPASERAAHAAYAAAQQGAFREFQHELYPNGEARPASDLSDDALRELADSLDLDLNRFAADFDSEDARASVTEDIDIATSLGVYATPAFIVNGSPILGAQPTPVFIDAIEQAIAAGSP